MSSQTDRPDPAAEETPNRRAKALEKPLAAPMRPLDDAVDVTFEELFHLEDLQRLQDEFARATHVASIITRPDGTPITAPSRFCRLYSDIIRKTDRGRANCYQSDLEAGETADQIAVHNRKIIALGEDRFETRHRRKDGSLFDVEVNVQYRSAEDGRLVAFLRDITRQKQIEAHLQVVWADVSTTYVERFGGLIIGSGSYK